MVPAEDDALGIHDFKLTANEARVLKIQFSDLPFAFHRFQIRSPGDRAGRDVFIARNFDGFHLLAALFDAYDFVKMARVMAYPFAC